jgi:hypothetical protein
METDVTRWPLAAVALGGLIALAHAAEPANPSDKSRGATPAAAHPGEREPWRKACPPPAEASRGPSTFKATGPCAFEHTGTFACEGLADDFYVSTTRKAANGATLTVYINVEKYHGPGDYTAAQMWIGVQDKTFIYRWSSDNLDITVGPGEAYAVLPSSKLDAEPVLVDCTGPMTNYQCSGRGESELFLATAEVVSGTLRCDTADRKKP